MWGARHQGDRPTDVAVLTKTPPANCRWNGTTAPPAFSLGRRAARGRAGHRGSPRGHRRCCDGRSCPRPRGRDCRSLLAHDLERTEGGQRLLHSGQSGLLVIAVPRAPTSPHCWRTPRETVIETRQATSTQRSRGAPEARRRRRGPPVSTCRHGARGGARGGHGIRPRVRQLAQASAVRSRVPPPPQALTPLAHGV